MVFVDAILASVRMATLNKRFEVSASIVAHMFKGGGPRLIFQWICIGIIDCVATHKIGCINSGHAHLSKHHPSQGSGPLLNSRALNSSHVCLLKF
jgi:hypothetical protein